MRRLPGIAAILLMLAACANEPRSPVDPRVGIHVDARSGRVDPAVSTSLGNVWVGASRYGGGIGTRLGPVSIGAGL